MARKYVSVKQHEKIVKDLTEKLNAAQREAADNKAGAKIWNEKWEELNLQLKSNVHTDGCNSGREAQVNDMVVSAVASAHEELFYVKANESNYTSLQRVLGAVQGKLALALLGMGQRPSGVGLYPDQEDAVRKLAALEQGIDNARRHRLY